MYLDILFADLLVGLLTQDHPSLFACGAVSRCEVDCISNERELGLVEAQDPENAVSVVYSNLNLKVLSRLVIEVLNELHHALGNPEDSQCRFSILLGFGELVLQKFEPSTRHVGFPHSFYFLHTFLLAVEIEGPKYLIQDVDHSILTLHHDVIKLADIAEQHCYLASIVGHEIF